MLDMLFGNNAGWFAVPALVGTLFFALRLGLLLLGHGFHADMDHGDVHADPSEGFKVLSVQSVGAFMMGFGWMGLAVYRSTNTGFGGSAAAGVLGGVFFVWLLGILLRSVYALQTSGTVDMHEAAGREGDVYATVPAAGGGRGQVRVNIDDRQRIYDAVSVGPELPTSTRVRIMRVNEDRTLTVAPA
ncbi:MAG: NfeD family protein [Phycisphaerales bacterium]|nr:NfeD family protein [Phycisphaerales bacterium]